MHNKTKASKASNALKALKRGFTLYELMIVCAMLVIVAGVVTSLVVYFNSYTKTVSTNSEYIEGLVDLRENIDYWFSKMDQTGYTITTTGIDDTPESESINGTDVTMWVTCGDDYYIGSYENDDGTMYLFCSEDGVYYPVQVPLYCKICVTEYTTSYSYTQNDNVRLQFSINMPVTGKTYICEVIYVGE